MERFRVEQEPGVTAPESWVLTMLEHSRVIGAATKAFRAGIRVVGQLISRRRTVVPRRVFSRSTRRFDLVWLLVLIALVCWALWTVIWLLISQTSWTEAGHVSVLALITMLRVMVLIALASLVWVPIGVYVGLNPKLTRVVQPIAQFMAAFPANLLFPLFVFGIVRWTLNPDIWLSPLIILGTQWYILFNVIAGASAIPSELRHAADNLRVRGWLWWRRVALPAVFPYFVTGAITASGGSWNAAYVAELVNWKTTEVRAHGVGAYLSQATVDGNFHAILLGIVVMCLFVITINRLLWRPLYYFAERKYRLT